MEPASSIADRGARSCTRASLAIGAVLEVQWEGVVHLQVGGLALLEDFPQGGSRLVHTIAKCMH